MSYSDAVTPSYVADRRATWSRRWSLEDDPFPGVVGLPFSPTRAHSGGALGSVAAVEGHADILAALALHAERLEGDGELDGPLLVHVLRVIDCPVELPGGI